MILEDKTYSLVSSFVPILVIIWFYVYIDLLTQDRKDRDRTELFVIITIGPLKDNWDSDLYFILLFLLGSFLHNGITFLDIFSMNNLTNSLSLFLCSNLVHQTTAPVSTMWQHKILVMAPNFVTLPFSLFTKVLMLVKILKFDWILKVSG